MKALLLAAGFGRRLRPLTNNTPKCLLKINGVPLIDIWLRNLKYFGVEQILINTSLFSKTSLIVIKNPQERLIKELENIKKIENLLIINGEGLKAKSKLKLYFDNHKNFISVPCYKLNRVDIKKIIDDRLNLKATEYFPHISLFYGNVTKEIKIKIMKELDAPKELTLSSICIVDVDEEINLWKVIECFPLKCKENVL